MLKMDLKINHLTFEEIKPYWKMLWGDVTIRRKSGILLLKGFDIMLNDNDDIVPTFFGAFDGDNIIGVNSGYAPVENQYRSRGLYVLPEYRRQGIAQMLLHATQEQGRKEKKNILWSMPRKEALPAYLKFSFKKISDFSDREFGENCFVLKHMKHY